MALETRVDPLNGVVVYNDTAQPVVFNPAKFTFYPSHKTIGLIPDQAGVEKVLHKLLESGFEGPSIELLSGEAGSKFVDATGVRRGVMGRLIRNLQNLTDERRLVQRYAQSMLEGEFVLAVLCKNRERIQSAVAAFMEGEGHSVYHFSPAMVERIIPWNQHLRAHHARTAPRPNSERPDAEL